jgi:hypothetical protein
METQRLSPFLSQTHNGLNSDRLKYNWRENQIIPLVFVTFSYTAGLPMISYKSEGDATDGYTYSTTIGAQAVGNTFDWGSQTAGTRREYAINVQLGPGK